MKTYVRSLLHRDAYVQMGKLIVIGGFNTIVTLGLSNVFKFGFEMRSEWAVSLAWVIGTLLSYIMNRTWTFDLRPDGASFRESGNFFFVNLLAWGVTVVIVKLAEWWLGELDGFTFNAAQIVAAGIIVIPKFAAYRDVVFKKSLNTAGSSRVRD